MKEKLIESKPLSCCHSPVARALLKLLDKIHNLLTCVIIGMLSKSSDTKRNLTKMLHLTQQLRKCDDLLVSKGAICPLRIALNH